MYKKHKQYRLWNYDYAQDGLYYITIVTKNRTHHFGAIENGVMLYSPVGHFVSENILQFCPGDHSENPYLQHPHFISASNTIAAIISWAILPNHIHLIVQLTNRNEKGYSFPNGLAPLSSGSVSSFINHFKVHIKKWCNQNGHAAFAWQERFYDRVIRNADEYQNIRNYIENNVLNWKEDDL
ncbi:MAG: hypothetical protein JST86_19275 [Bacteroidetes bacterium]|nr:hypothetical protein [Bacteroidota bacterium]